jgi:dihydroorotate dehydrogenase (fumarate)
MMPSLETSYMGLKLRNPIIVGSSGLTRSVEKVKECADAGAGAVVVKSLFEEVLAKEDWGLESSLHAHPEAYDYLQSELQLQYGPQDYCDLISEMKRKVKIPVIGSINCISNKWWPNFAKKIEAAGADAIELNVFSMPNDPAINAASQEEKYYEILAAIKDKVSIPVALKIGMYFTSLPFVTRNLAKKGVNAIVMFNRFTEPDIDIKTMKLKTTFSFSSKDNVFPVLRWVALLSGQVDCDISATTGIHSSEGVIKLLLAGAATTQLVSVLYKKGLGEIENILKGIETWMGEHKFDSISQFQGKLNFSEAELSEVYLRAQFMEKIKDIV